MKESIKVINEAIEVIYNQDCLNKLNALVGSQINISHEVNVIDGDNWIVKFNENNGWFTLPEHSFIYQKPDGSWTVF